MHISFIIKLPNKREAKENISALTLVIILIIMKYFLLCSNCLNQVMEDSSIAEPTGMCVIDFYNNKIRMLQKNITAFQFDDYYVSCRSRERQTDDITLEMDLLIFYCPKRYGE